MTVIVLAHGSKDPRHAEGVQAIAGNLAADLGVEVAAAYLEHSQPAAASVPPGQAAVVVPLFLASGFHVRNDVPAAVAELRFDSVVVTEPPLMTDGADWVQELLAEVEGSLEITLVCAGTSDPEALVGWQRTADRFGVDVRHLSGNGPRLVEPTGALLPALVADGFFADRLRACSGPARVLPTVGQSQAFRTRVAEVVRMAMAGGTVRSSHRAIAGHWARVSA